MGLFCRSTAVTLAPLCALLLAGCASGTAGPSSLAGKAGSTLSTDKINLVLAAARKMTDDPAATVTGLRAKAAVDGGTGSDVCGYVNATARQGVPLYVELRSNEGALTAERGQVGATPQNLAKVRFMCRKHGEW